jgi:hypothetical protein
MIKRIIILLSLVLLFTPLAAMGYNVDLYDQFPDTQGQNGFTAQGCVTATLTFYDLKDLGSYIFGNDTHPSNLPLVQRNTGYGQNELMLHPLYSTSDIERAVLTWDVPDDKTGPYNISGQFRLPITGGDGVTVYVLKNDFSNKLLEQTLYPLGSITFNIDVTLSATDQLRFAVDSYGNSNWDHALLQGDISLVPIPGTVLLLGPGLLGLVGLRRIRKS